MLFVIAAVQFATAATFVAVGFAAFRYGAAAQRAAEGEVARQGLPIELLVRHHFRVEESFLELMLPLAIALILVGLAVLNLALPNIGEGSTWILQPILLVAGGLVTGSQVFVVQTVESAFRKSGDPEAKSLDLKRVMDAVSGVFPRWLRSVVVTRFVLVTLGSALILVLMAVN